MDVDRCICCGVQVPEGRQVCWSCEHMTCQTSKSPSKRQIELADAIANTLNIDFPLSSQDFTAAVYWKFINDNIKKARNYWNENESDEFLDDMDWFSPLNQ